MISVPNLPTDSLYKFMFIFGLILIIFSAYNYSKTSVGTTDYESINDSLKLINKKNLKIDSVIKVCDILLDSCTREEKLKETVLISGGLYTQSELHNNILQLYVLDLDVLDEPGDYNYIRDGVRFLTPDRVSTIVYKLDSAKSVLNSKSAAFKPKIKQYDVDVLTFKVTAILGSMLFLLGGLLWYMKIQRKQDKLLDLEVKRAERDFNSTSVD